MFSSPRTSLYALLALVCTLAMPLSASAGTEPETYTVGSDMDCDFPSLDAALLAAALNDLDGTPTADYIHLSRNLSYSGEHVISNHSVWIRGGYSSCADTTPSGRTTLSATSTERIITIERTDLPNQVVVLQDLDLVGSPMSSLTEGGILRAEGLVAANIVNSQLTFGHATEGIARASCMASTTRTHPTCTAPSTSAPSNST